MTAVRGYFADLLELIKFEDRWNTCIDMLENINPIFHLGSANLWSNVTSKLKLAEKIQLPLGKGNCTNWSNIPGKNYLFKDIAYILTSDVRLWHLWDPWKTAISFLWYLPLSWLKRFSHWFTSSWDTSTSTLTYPFNL